MFRVCLDRIYPYFGNTAVLKVHYVYKLTLASNQQCFHFIMLLKIFCCCTYEVLKKYTHLIKNLEEIYTVTCMSLALLPYVELTMPHPPPVNL
jgi:hypothetical protein